VTPVPMDSRLQITLFQHCFSCWVGWDAGVGSTADARIYMVCASWPFGEWKVMGFIRDHGDAPFTSCLHIASTFMIDLLAYLSWLLANVVIPIFAPVALLPLLSFSLAYRDVTTAALKAAVRHGQLFWTVIAMCSGACYELGSAMDKVNSARSHALIWIALVWHTGFIVASSVLVVFGSADAQLLRNTRVAEPRERAMTRLSLSFVTVIAITFAASHYLINQYLS
jgi:hypothetical protein